MGNQACSLAESWENKSAQYEFVLRDKGWTLEDWENVI